MLAMRFCNGFVVQSNIQTILCVFLKQKFDFIYKFFVFSDLFSFDYLYMYNSQYLSKWLYFIDYNIETNQYMHRIPINYATININLCNDFYSLIIQLIPLSQTDKSPRRNFRISGEEFVHFLLCAI